MQGTERKHRNTLFVFLFVHCHKQDGCVVLFLASVRLLSMLVTCDFDLSDNKVWMEGLFLHTRGFSDFRIRYVS